MAMNQDDKPRRFKISPRVFIVPHPDGGPMGVVTKEAYDDLAEKTDRYRLLAETFCYCDKIHPLMFDKCGVCESLKVIK